MKPSPDLSYLKKLRRDLQSNPLVAEVELWKFLKNKKLKGRLFKRKHRIDKYVVDFYCLTENLVVNLSPIQKDMEHFLRDQKINSISIESKKVFENIEEVLNTIAEAFLNE